MNALDSPLEALAINYASFGIFAAVNNLWTWVAVVTAALSFWKIRAGTVADVKAVGCSSLPDEPSPSPRPSREDASSSYGCSSVPEEKPCPSRQTDDISHVTTTASTQHLVATVSGDIYGMTKGRFTVYYDDDNYQIMEEADQEAEIVAEEVSGCGGSEWWSGWERVLRVRSGDMEWYRHQDLTVLDGSVVRLWDGRRSIR